MYQIRMTAYEGEQPYIFISYAHKDNDAVWELIDRLADEGYRIWYDDGIAPGSEWPEYIAEHMLKADSVIAFITPASVASPNCRREIHFALDKRKHFIYVVLEPTELSAGLELQLSSQNGLFRFDYPSEERFFRKLKNASALAACRDKRPETDEDDEDEGTHGAKSSDAEKHASAKKRSFSKRKHDGADEDIVIEKEFDGDCLTVMLSGRLDTTTSPTLEAELDECLDELEELIIDLNGLDYVSSSGLRVLLAAQKRMNRRGSMVVRNVNETIMEIFEITGFSDILTIE